MHDGKHSADFCLALDSHGRELRVSLDMDRNWDQHLSGIISEAFVWSQTEQHDNNLWTLIPNVYRTFFKSVPALIVSFCVSTSILVSRWSDQSLITTVRGAAAPWLILHHLSWIPVKVWTCPVSTGSSLTGARSATACTKSSSTPLPLATLMLRVKVVSTVDARQVGISLGGLLLAGKHGGTEPGP